ncbi:tyrosine-type recombinase/integrase [Oribacterium sp. NK2B42]|uniref:tyrosine-type recombinase/integrase n=1 Tax=Oribacterium sp. NK2B42 TaxID=689781 RepID=UPI00041428ED|nr:tyrosine-type recombinase/integrase [Oribacterium sp. NK2B42]
MQVQSYSFEELRATLLERLSEQGCTPITVTGYRYQCNSIFKWLKGNGYNYYSAKGGDAFLNDYYSKHGKNQYYSNLRTVVYRLNDILNNTWINLHTDRCKHFCLTDDFGEIVDRYCSRITNKGYAKGTIIFKRYAVSWFLDELVKLDCKTLSDLSPASISQACIKITYQGLWGEIRLFLRYLNDYEGVNSDYSTLVPHYRKPYVIPSVYSIEEIRRIEEIIDTSTLLGKRDYAMILLASRMGMRSGDIVKLKIKDVENRSSIDILQEKTRHMLHIPLIRDVKSAIDDYLSARPSVKSDFIFISVYSPHNPITTSSIRAALKKYIMLANVDTGKRKKGPHALRSSLASSMVNDGISYETVRKVLGHSSKSAIKHYARVDIERLRRYSLMPPLPTGKFFAFLNGEV